MLKARSRSQSKELSRIKFWRLRLGFGFIAMLSLALISGITALLVIPKVWLSTPVDFVPQIRISVIDMLQARSLAKSARSLERADHPVEACQAWRSAIANNPGDLALSEAFIRCVLGQENPDAKLIMGGASQAFWLLRLSKTNQTSLELASQMFFRAGLEEELWGLLSSTNVVITADLAKVFAITAFELGEVETFHRTWVQNEKVFRHDGRLSLYHSAWSAIWGPASKAISSLDEINQAADTKDLRVLALRLRGMVAAKRLDSGLLDSTLKSLEEAHGDRLEDHVRVWLLRDYLGHRNDAIKAAKPYPCSKVSGLRQGAALRT
jgi:hypothetical protein